MTESANKSNKYVLRSIESAFISDECFTPISHIPRQTQPTVGKYVTRTDGKFDRDINVHPRILEMWTNRNHEWWVNKPGKDDYFLHDLAKKYSGTTFNYCPKNLPHRKLFPRPYSLEIDCLEEMSKRGLEEDDDDETLKLDCVQLEDKKADDNGDSYFPPPFWWQRTDKAKGDLLLCTPVENVSDRPGKKIYKRWRPIPELLPQHKRDWCERRLLMNRVGQLYKHEACMFYLENYPSPNITLTLPKFSS